MPAQATSVLTPKVVSAGAALVFACGTTCADAGLEQANRQIVKAMVRYEVECFMSLFSLDTNGLRELDFAGE
jgi:hypothetical protein